MSDPKQKPGETRKEMGLRMSVVQKILELMTAAFSLVAALAWNDAIHLCAAHYCVGRSGRAPTFKNNRVP